MSNPFIQVEIDAAKRAPHLASALGIHIREAMGGLTLMWLHVYGEKVTEITAFYLQVFFGVDGAKAGEALVELRFLERVGDSAWRVRGSGRYRRLSEKRQAAGRKGGQASAEARTAVQATTQENQEVSKQRQAKASKGQFCSSKNEAKSTFGQANHEQLVKQTGRKPKQKVALEPIDLSPTERERSMHEAPVDGAPRPAPLGAAGQGAKVINLGPDGKPRGWRGKLVRGSAEYKYAASVDDWLVGWEIVEPEALAVAI